MDKSKLTIFVVDDDKYYNTVISTYLKIKGFKVQSFHSGEECLQAPHQNPDVILMDYMMTGIDGITTMCQMKKLCPNAYFILLSGQTDINIVLDAMHQGAFDYIMKDNHAKENALNKIDQILRFRKVSRDKEMYRKSIIMVVSILAGTWVSLLVYYFSIK